MNRNIYKILFVLLLFCSSTDQTKAVFGGLFEDKRKAGEAAALASLKTQMSSMKPDQNYDKADLIKLFPIDNLTPGTAARIKGIKVKQYSIAQIHGSPYYFDDHNYVSGAMYNYYGYEDTVRFDQQELKDFKKDTKKIIDNIIKKIDDEETEAKADDKADKEKNRELKAKFGGAIAQALEASAQADAKGRNDRENAAQMFGLVTEKLQDPMFVGGGILATIAVVGGGKLAFDGAQLVIKRVKNALEQPNIITKSTIPKNPLEAFKRMIFGREEEPSRLEEFEAPTKELQTELPFLINEIRNAVDANTDLPNLLFYGPPGTGKTMFAEILAQESGKEYACLSGANFTKCTPDQAVQKIEELAIWARAQPQGAIIFIDEAEIVFTDRTYPDATELSKAVTNKFLELFPKPTDPKLMFIFASNNYGVLDVAIDSRISQALHFVNPPFEAKLKLITKYLTKEEILLDDIMTSRLTDLKVIFEPLVGRDIEDITKEISRKVNANGEPFTYDLLKDTINKKCDKKSFSKKERAHYQKARFGHELDSSIPTAAAAA